MKEIMVRGKRKDNIGWVYGTGVVYGVMGGATILQGISDGISKYPVKRETVTLSTGMLDKNAKEIFEGDIVRSEKLRETGIVLWRHTGFDLYLGKRKATDCEIINGRKIDAENNTEMWGMLFKGFYEVIGNCFDNPGMMAQYGLEIQ